MGKKEIFEAIMQAEPEDIEDLAQVIRGQYSPQITRQPEFGLLMFRAEESIECRVFNVGEILVTTTEVRIFDSLGYAMILGSDKEKALNAAVLMAAVEAELPERTRVEELALGLEVKTAEKEKEEQEVVNSTRVRFELMGGQDPNVVGQIQKGWGDE